MRAPVIAVLVSSTAIASAQPGLQPAATASAPLGKAGLFGGGVSVELDLGSIQAVTSHDRVIGGDIGIALQYDLGPRWALRMPIELGAGGVAQGGFYGELLVIPGALYRFRYAAGQRWVPSLGAGIRLGSVGVGNNLLGRPLVIACCHDWGGHDGHPDPNTEDAVTASAEGWAGIEWNRTSWFALHLAVAVGYEHVGGTGIVVARETLGVRLSF